MSNFTTPKPRQQPNLPYSKDDASATTTLNVSLSEENRRNDSNFSAYSANHSLFRSTTIAPSPPPSASASKPFGAAQEVSTLDTKSHLLPIDTTSSISNPLNTGLRIQTDITPVTAASTNTSLRSSPESVRHSQKTQSINVPLARTPSIKTIFASSIGSNSNLGSAPNSALSSPMLSAMADVTPLPSPLMSGDSPGPWKRLNSRPVSRDLMVPKAADSALVTVNGESISAAIANQSKRRAYHGLVTNASEAEHTDREKTGDGHARNRSVSEYTPEPLQVPKPRHITVSGSYAPVADNTPDSNSDSYMRREPHLAVQRGLAPVTKPPTPPSSRAGGESSDSESSLSAQLDWPHKRPRYEYFDAFSREDQKRRRWRALKVLGQGTFSKVMLATSQMPVIDNQTDEDDVFRQMDGIVTPVQSDLKIDRKKLVAVKICEHGPKGGASEERVEISLKRELEIMKSIHHPSLVHLKAWSIEETRAILVLSYCPGGDLFEVASEYRDVLVPSLLRRMFAELVGAIQYLHERHIVHRDIKLENVLVNLPQHELRREQDWAAYPYPVITLTDLGLSRRVADDEKLTTRCGSDDYAAPEVIMGQPYDGRATDAWSLGVLLYALLESRLPFDPNPNMSEGQKQRSRTSHRIARIEWSWIEYFGEDGDHEADPEKFKEKDLEGAMLITEGLLKRARSRWTMQQVADHKWVKGGVRLPDGIKFPEEDIPEEVVTIDGRIGGLDVI